MLTKLVVRPAPHLLDPDSTAKIMYSVLVALLPAVLAGVILFGVHALWLMLVSVAAACLTEAACQLLRRQPVTITDGSAVITGLLLALNLPPGFPLGHAVFGSFMAIALGKQLFGGLGENPFNPALIGRVVLAAAYPLEMTSWQPLGGIMADAVTTATPIGLIELGNPPPLGDLLLGNVLGCIGETSVVAILIGGIFLLWRKVIDWRIPVGYLGSVAVLSGFMGGNPLLQLCTGGLMLGAFFMATDLVTCPITKPGRWIFAIGAGVVVVLIRRFGGLPEGVSYSILLMNALTPLINKITTPRVFGEVRGRA